jgi:hypothetical protein
MNLRHIERLFSQPPSWWGPGVTLKPADGIAITESELNSRVVKLKQSSNTWNKNQMISVVNHRIGTVSKAIKRKANGDISVLGVKLIRCRRQIKGGRPPFGFLVEVI